MQVFDGNEIRERMLRILDVINYTVSIDQRSSKISFTKAGIDFELPFEACDSDESLQDAFIAAYRDHLATQQKYHEMSLEVIKRQLDNFDSK